MKRIVTSTQTEKQFATAVGDLLRSCGYVFLHVFEQEHYARRTTKGFPDYFAIHVETFHLVVLEIKSEKGQLTPHQEWWLMALRKACPQAVVRVVRPSQWEELVTLLRR